MARKKTDCCRVIFVLPSFTAGGAERVLITLMNGLDTGKFHKGLVVLKNEGPLRSLVSSDIPVSVLLDKSSFFFSIFFLLKTLKKERPDVIVSTIAPMNFMLLLLKPFFPGKHFIIREAITPSFFLNKKDWKARISFWGYKILYPLANTILSPSQKIIDELRNIIGDRNYKYLPNPVDVETIRRKAKETAPIKKKNCVKFLCSGRLHNQKGFDRLITALASFDMESGHEWELVILGEGEERKALESLITLHQLQGKITLAGHLDNPWALMAQSDYFLLPSRWEGLPNVVLESLACGTPVIALKESGGIAEIAKHTKGNDLIIVETIEKMTEEMRKKMRREDNAYPHPSLLPAVFYKDRIIEQFIQLISEST